MRLAGVLANVEGEALAARAVLPPHIALEQAGAGARDVARRLRAGSGQRTAGSAERVGHGGGGKTRPQASMPAAHAVSGRGRRPRQAIPPHKGCTAGRAEQAHQAEELGGVTDQVRHLPGTRKEHGAPQPPPLLVHAAAAGRERGWRGSGLVCECAWGGPADAARGTCGGGGAPAPTRRPPASGHSHSKVVLAVGAAQVGQDALQQVLWQGAKAGALAVLVVGARVRRVVILGCSLCTLLPRAVLGHRLRAAQHAAQPGRRAAPGAQGARRRVAGGSGRRRRRGGAAAGRCRLLGRRGDHGRLRHAAGPRAGPESSSKVTPTSGQLPRARFAGCCSLSRSRQLDEAGSRARDPSQGTERCWRSRRRVAARVLSVLCGVLPETAGVPAGAGCNQGAMPCLLS